MEDFAWLVQRYQAIREWSAEQPQSALFVPDADTLLQQAIAFAQDRRSPTPLTTSGGRLESRAQAGEFLALLYRNPVKYGWSSEVTERELLCYAQLEVNFASSFCGSLMSDFAELIREAQAPASSENSPGTCP